MAHAFGLKPGEDFQVETVLTGSVYLVGSNEARGIFENEGSQESLAADEDFAEVVAGEKELGGREILEDLFDHPVVEVLSGAATVLFTEKECIAALDLIGEDGHFFNALVGVEDGKEGGTGAGDGENLLKNGFEEFGAQILQRIPEEDGVELAFFVAEGVLDEDVDAIGFELAFEIAGAVAEGEFEGAIEGVGARDVVLLEEKFRGGGRTAKVENFKAVLPVQREEELVETVGRTSQFNGAGR